MDLSTLSDEELQAAYEAKMAENRAADMQADASAMNQPAASAPVQQQAQPARQPSLTADQQKEWEDYQKSQAIDNPNDTPTEAFGRTFFNSFFGQGRKDAMDNYRLETRTGGIGSQAMGYLSDLGNSFWSGLAKGGTKIGRAVGNLTGSKDLVGAMDSADKAIDEYAPTDMTDTAAVDANGNERERTWGQRIAQIGKDVMGVTGEFAPAAAGGAAGAAFTWANIGAGGVNRYNELVDNVMENAERNGMSKAQARAIGIAGAGIDILQNAFLMGKFRGGNPIPIEDKLFKSFIMRQLAGAAKTGVVMGGGGGAQDALNQLAANGDIDFKKTGRAVVDSAIEGAVFHLMNAAMHEPIRWSTAKAAKKLAGERAGMRDDAASITAEKDEFYERRRADASRMVAIEAARKVLSDPQGMAMFMQRNPDLCVDIINARRRGEDVDMALLWGDGIHSIGTVESFLDKPGTRDGVKGVDGVGELRQAFQTQEDANNFGDRLLLYSDDANVARRMREAREQGEAVAGANEDDVNLGVREDRRREVVNEIREATKLPTFKEWSRNEARAAIERGEQPPSYDDLKARYDSLARNNKHDTRNLISDVVGAGESDGRKRVGGTIDRNVAESDARALKENVATAQEKRAEDLAAANEFIGRNADEKGVNAQYQAFLEQNGRVDSDKSRLDFYDVSRGAKEEPAPSANHMGEAERAKNQDAQRLERMEDENRADRLVEAMPDDFAEWREMYGQPDNQESRIQFLNYFNGKDFALKDVKVGGMAIDQVKTAREAKDDLYSHRFSKVDPEKLDVSEDAIFDNYRKFISYDFEGSGMTVEKAVKHMSRLLERIEAVDNQGEDQKIVATALREILRGAKDAGVSVGDLPQSSADRASGRRAYSREMRKEEAVKKLSELRRNAADKLQKLVDEERAGSRKADFESAIRRQDIIDKRAKRIETSRADDLKSRVESAKGGAKGERETLDAEERQYDEAKRLRDQEESDAARRKNFEDADNKAYRELNILENEIEEVNRYEKEGLAGAGAIKGREEARKRVAELKAGIERRKAAYEAGFASEEEYSQHVAERRAELAKKREDRIMGKRAAEEDAALADLVAEYDAEIDAMKEANQGRDSKAAIKDEVRQDRERERVNAEVERDNEERAATQDEATAREAAEYAEAENDPVHSFKRDHGIKEYADWLGDKKDSAAMRWTYNKMVEKAVRRAVADKDPVAKRVLAEMDKGMVQGEFDFTEPPKRDVPAEEARATKKETSNAKEENPAPQAGGEEAPAAPAHEPAPSPAPVADAGRRGRPAGAKGTRRGAPRVDADEGAADGGEAPAPRGADGRPGVKSNFAKLVDALRGGDRDAMSALQDAFREDVKAGRAPTEDELRAATEGMNDAQAKAVRGFVEKTVAWAKGNAGESSAEPVEKPAAKPDLKELGRKAAEASRLLKSYSMFGEKELRAYREKLVKAKRDNLVKAVDDLLAYRDAVKDAAPKEGGSYAGRADDADGMRFSRDERAEDDPSLVRDVTKRVDRFAPGLKVEFRDFRADELAKGASNAAAAYDPRTNTVVMPRGATVQDLIHEVGWHAAWDYAKKNSPELLNKMRRYAAEAPRDVKEAVFLAYGDFSGERLLDEVGAMRWTRDASHAGVAEALRAKANQGWFRNMMDGAVETMRRMMLKGGANLRGLDKLSPEEAMSRLAGELVKGRALKERQGVYAETLRIEDELERISADAAADPDNFLQVDGDDGERYSVRSANNDIENGRMERALVKNGVFDKQGAKDFIAKLGELVSAVTKHGHMFDAGEDFDVDLAKKQDPRRFKPFKPNSDALYKKSLDFSTLCKKRIVTQAIIDKLQTQVKGDFLSREEQVAVRDMLKEYQKQEKALQVACHLCYVEAARLKAPEQQMRLFSSPEKMREEFVNYLAIKSKAFKGATEEMKRKWRVDNGYPADATKDQIKELYEKRVADGEKGVAKVSDLNEATKAFRTGNYRPTEAEEQIISRFQKMGRAPFLDSNKVMAMASNDPVIYDFYTTYIRNATKSKSLEGDTPYYFGDSRELTKKFIQKMNDQGTGIRHQSWSDFQLSHMLDTVVALADLSTRGAKMHAYTKVGDMIRIFGKSGTMFNMSLIPDAKNGFSPTEGMDIKEARELRRKFPETAGTVAVAKDQRNLISQLNNKDIDYVIPYHSSGMPIDVRRMAGIGKWFDFQNLQHAGKNTAIAKREGVADWHKEPNIYELVKQTGLDGYAAMEAAAQRYVELCNERGLKPKFADSEGLFMKRKDGTYALMNRNYWKTLVDHKMVNQENGRLIEQQVVRPEFDLEYAKKAMKREAKEYDSGVADRAYEYVKKQWDGIKDRIGNLKKQDIEDEVRYSRSSELDRDFPGWNDNPGSTQISTTVTTYGKLGAWFRAKHGEKRAKEMKILDASSGLGYGSAEMRRQGLDVDDVEPYQTADRKGGKGRPYADRKSGFTYNSDPATFDSYDKVPDGKYDLVVSNAVLNVIPDDWRANVLTDMARKVKPGGQIYINVLPKDYVSGLKNPMTRDEALAKGGRAALAEGRPIMLDPQEALARNAKGGSYQRGYSKAQMADYVHEILGADWKVEPSKIANGVVVTRPKDAGGDDGDMRFSRVRREDVSKDAVVIPRGNGQARYGIYVNNGTRSENFVSRILNGEKTIETRTKRAWDAMQRAGIGKNSRVAIIEDGKVRGYVTISAVKEYGSAEEFAKDKSRHFVDGGEYGYDEGKGKVGLVLSKPQWLKEPLDIGKTPGVKSTADAENVLGEGMRFSRINGESGAANIGKSADVAKQMLGDRKWKDLDRDEKMKIRMATGWEVGSDGLWRYETDDGIVNNESIDIKRNFNGKLSEMLPADHELFKAYPEARDIDLKVTYRKNGSYAGWQNGNAIEVNAGPDGKESRSTLVHEIQHWIQGKEGFAIGGNSGTYSRVARNKVIAGIEDEAVKKVVEAYDGSPRNASKMDEIAKILLVRSSTMKMLDQKRAAKKLLMDANAFNRVMSDEEMSDVFRSAAKYIREIHKNDRGTYERLAGEVESRNAERRTGEDIGSRLIEDTEDVPRDNQLVFDTDRDINGKEDDKTRYSRRPAHPNPNPGNFMDDTRSEKRKAADSYMRNMSDRFYDVKQVVADALEAGGMSRKDALAAAQNDEASPYHAKRVQTGKAAEDVQRVEATEKELVRTLESLRGDLDVDDFGDYFYAMHAADRNKQIDKALVAAGKSATGNGSGLTDKAANAVINSYSPEQVRAMEEARQKLVVRLNDEFGPEYLRKAGLIDQDSVTRLKDAYGSDYVPLRDDVTDDGVDYNGSTSVANPLMRAKGRNGDKAENPVAFMLHGALRNIANAHENMARENLAKFVEAHPEMGVVRKMTPMDREGDGMISFRRNAMEDGRERNSRYVIELYGSRGAQLGRAFTEKDLVRGPKWMAGTMRKFASFATQLSPTFSMRNFVKDTMEVTMDTLATGGPRAALQFLKGQAQLMPLWNKETRRVFREFAETGKVTGNSQIADQYRRFIKAGGLIGGGGANEGYAKHMEDLRDISKRLSRAGETGRAIGKAWDAYKDVVGGINESIENLTRFNNFRNRIENGESDAEAVMNSREGSTDFGMYGNQRWLNSVYMFSNSILGGTMRAAKSMTYGKYGRRLALGMVALGVMEEMADIAMNGDDDEKRTDEGGAKGVSDYDRENSLHFRMGDKYVRIPIHGGPWSVLKYAGNHAVRAAMGKESWEDAVKKVADSAATIASHFTGTGEKGFGEGSPSLMNSMTPSVVQPLAQVYLNEDYKGAKIHRDHTNGKAKNKPDYQYAKDDTNKLFVQMSRMLNNLPFGGGNDDVKGRFSVPAEDLEYLSKQVFKNFGTDLVNAAVETPSRLVQSAASGENQFELRTTPFIKDFVKTVGRAGSDYYPALERVEREQVQYDALKTAAERRAFLREHPAANGSLKTLKQSIEILAHRAKGEMKVGGKWVKANFTDGQMKAAKEKAEKQMARFVKLSEGGK